MNQQAASQPTRVLLDLFHHMPPGHRIGADIAVGGYQTNVGRYTPGDVYHPNGLAALETDLAAQGCEVRVLIEPFSDAALFDADILIAANPDYPLYDGSSPHRWTPRDVDALLAFARRGGGVLLLVNSFLSRPDFWEENFDYERVSLLFDRLGMRWDPNYMSDDKTIERARSGDMIIGYGQGGRLSGPLPKDAKPLLTFEGNTYGFEVAVGAGRLVVLGDAGMTSNGLMCFPGFQNAEFMRGVIHRLRPAWTKDGAARKWTHRRYGHLSAAPSPNGLTESIIRGLRPGAGWMVDHHYRHMTWDVKEGTVEPPIDLAELWSAGPTKHARLNWLSIDHDGAGPAFDVELSVRRRSDGRTTDIKVLGRAQTDQLKWSDLFRNPEPLRAAGEIDQVHTMFQLDAVLDEKNGPKAARWRLGQILYARSTRSHHYGYEIILNSLSGVMLPTT